MLIYHITDNQLYCTQVLLGGVSKSDISHFKKQSPEHCEKKHRESIKELRSNGRVYVTGGTYAGAIYEGEFREREGFNHYIGNTKFIKD